MSSTIIDPLEKMIRDAGEGWLIDWHAPPETAINSIREKLQHADAAARHRLGGKAPRLTPETLLAAYDQNPHKVRAFLEVVGSINSPEILVMVWRILEGMEIAAIQMQYDAMGSFHLRVKLSSPSLDESEEEYESNDIDDAVVLRHIGTMKLASQGVFNGFYALRIAGK